MFFTLELVCGSGRGVSLYAITKGRQDGTSLLCFHGDNLDSTMVDGHAVRTVCASSYSMYICMSGTNVLLTTNT